MPADEARVTYKALANFLALKKAVAGAKKDLADLRKEEAKTNSASLDGSKKVAAQYQAETKALGGRTKAHKDATAAVLAHNKALQDNVKLTKDSASAADTAANAVKSSSAVIKDATTQTNQLSSARKDVKFVANDLAKAETAVSNATKRTSSEMSSGATFVQRFKQRLAELNSEGNRFIPVSRRVESGSNAVLNVFKKLGNFRPHLIPPFVALVPIIAGLLSLLNPLVSVLGAVGAAAVGAGGNLLSLGGAALAIVPMIAAAIASVGALITAFSGIGGVFQKYSAAQKAIGGGGGGGGGTSAADQAWNLMKAEERLSDAQENAVQAQKDLNDARTDAIKKLKDLANAVQHDVLSEADATADLQQATEDYYNTMADPSSTLGDKEKATANLADAQQALSDAQQQTIDDQNALNDAQAKGVEGSDEVIQAQKNLRDALRDVRDAQHDLNKQVAGGGGGGGGGVSAMDAFREALAKLSPSAQKVVLALIGMQDAWKKVQQAVQEAFFSKIVDDMDDLAGALPTVQNLLVKAAGALGKFTHNLIQLVTSDAWKSDFEIISDQNVKLIDLAGQSLLNLLSAAKDLVIAAGPFAEDLLRSFERLTKSFAGIVANARETGSLARWLNIVYGRLQQWWRIIKNVAETLFNYGAASASFGQWITDGLEKSTKSWLEASEEARKQDSPFQKWLERLKPLLTQIKGLFGDFFHWLSKTAQDNDAITNATNILSDIRTKLGPALSKLFDALDKSGIGQDFVSSITSIVDSISSLVQEGGASGFKSFFQTIASFFKAVADFAKSPGGHWFVQTFAPVLGSLAAITFVGKFTGLFTLFGWLTKLASNAKVLKVLEGIGGLTAGGKAAKATATAEALASGASTETAAAAGAAAASKAGAKSVAVKGGGALAAILGGADLVSTALNPASKNPFQGATTKKQRQAAEGQILSGAGSGAISGAVAGAGIGTLIEPGGGTAIGAGIGAGVGAINGAISSGGGFDQVTKGLQAAFKDPKGFEQVQKMVSEDLFGKGFAADVLTNISTLNTKLFIEWPQQLAKGAVDLWNSLPDLGKWLADRGKDILTWFQNLPQSIAGGISDFWTKTLPSIGQWFQDRIKDFGTFFTTTLPFAIGLVVGTFWYKVLPDIGQFLSDTLTNIVTWFTQLPTNIANLAIDIWTGLTSPTGWFQTMLSSIVAWFQNLPAQIAGLAINLWNGLVGVGKWLAARWTDVVTWFKGLPGQIAGLALNLWNSLQGVGAWLGTQLSNILTWARNLPGQIAKAAGNIFSQIVGSFSAGVAVSKKGAIGGLVPAYLASGGKVRKLGDRRYNMDPRGTDTQPAMLTPGEYVVQKKRVDDVGAGNMELFNDGVLTFAELLRRSKKNKDMGLTAISYFDGGGIVGSQIASAISAAAPIGGKGASYNDYSMHFGDIIIQNPKRESASQSLPSAVRSVAYAGGRRKPNARLDGDGDDD